MGTFSFFMYMMEFVLLGGNSYKKNKWFSKQNLPGPVTEVLQGMMATV